MNAERPLLLLVDDEAQLRRVLKPTLEASGYAVETATTGAEALRLAAAQPPACTLLDLGLPDLDGSQVLRRLRGFSDAPILILSARDQPRDKIAALDAGANDFIEKPFDTGELLARIRAALRSAPALRDLPPVVQAGALTLDFAARQARVEGAVLPLTPREYELLVVFARNAGRVLTHRHLLHAIWGPAHTADVQYLRVYVGQLRQKLGAAAAWLQTEPGVGYRWQAAPDAAPTKTGGV